MRLLVGVSVVLLYISVADGFVSTATFPHYAQHTTLVRPSPNIKAKTAQRHPCRLFPVAPLGTEDKLGVQLSAVRVIPISEPKHSWWQRFKRWITSSKDVTRSNNEHTRSSQLKQASNYTDIPRNLVTWYNRQLETHPALFWALTAAVSAYVTDLILARTLWGEYPLGAELRLGHLVDVASQYGAYYKSFEWFESRFPQRSLSHMIYKTMIAHVLLGSKDAAAVTKFPVAPRGKCADVGGMSAITSVYSPILRFFCFALPLKYRGPVSSLVWSAISVLQAKLQMSPKTSAHADYITW